jgi:hypothetical protein
VRDPFPIRQRPVHASGKPNDIGCQPEVAMPHQFLHDCLLPDLDCGTCFQQRPLALLTDGFPDQMHMGVRLVGVQYHRVTMLPVELHLSRSCVRKIVRSAAACPGAMLPAA